MKSSTLKRVVLCTLLLLVGALGGYLLASHQSQRKTEERFFPHRPTNIHSMFDKTFIEMEHREKDMQEMFNNLEKDFFNESKKEIEANIDDLNFATGNNSESKGSFTFFQKTSKNGEDTSYEVNGKWNEGENDGIITMTGINTNGKEFSFSGTIQNGKSEGILIDADGNSKKISFDDIDINNIYNNSNNIIN